MITKTTCPKCGAINGDDWSQCRGECPMPMSPHYKSKTTPWKVRYENAIFCGDEIVYVGPSNAGTLFNPEYDLGTNISPKNVELIVRAVNFYREHHND